MIVCRRGLSKLHSSSVGDVVGSPVICYYRLFGVPPFQSSLNCSYVTINPHNPGARVSRYHFFDKVGFFASVFGREGELLCQTHLLPRLRLARNDNGQRFGVSAKVVEHGIHFRFGNRGLVNSLANTDESIINLIDTSWTPLSLLTNLSSI
jgi:hypothetical protein